MPRSSTNSYNDLFPAVKTVKTLHRKFTPTIYTTINYLHLMETVQVHFGSQMPGAGGSVITKMYLHRMCWPSYTINFQSEFYFQVLFQYSLSDYRSFGGHQLVLLDDAGCWWGNAGTPIFLLTIWNYQNNNKLLNFTIKLERFFSRS